MSIDFNNNSQHGIAKEMTSTANSHRDSQRDGEIDRREFLSWTNCGIGSVALASLLAKDQSAQAAVVPGEADDPPPHFPAKATRVIQIVLCGGLSQVDSFDYKPVLESHHGQSLASDEKPDVFFGKVGLLRRSDWAFRQRGQSGLWISDLFPHLAGVADELTVIKSMFAETSNHTPATFQESSGFRLNGFPVLGSWLSFGLGTESENLPAYVVLPDTRGLPAGGSINWTNGFLPARHQGVAFRSRGPAIDDLFPAAAIPGDTQQATRRLLAEMNRTHLEERGVNDALSARMRSYALAAKMQLAVPEAPALDGETQETHRRYGLDHPNTEQTARACLLARRLLERGVRFVQLFSGGAFGSPRINWDGHEDMRKNHGREAARIDRPVAALIDDLRQRGMLDDTLVLITTEFGRTPFTQSNPDKLGAGRDHNQYGFSTVVAGGATDDIGMRAVENRVHWHDFHATVLHLLGIDHERLSFYHNGIRRRLTNVHGHVIDDILA